MFFFFISQASPINLTRYNISNFFTDIAYKSQILLILIQFPWNLNLSNEHFFLPSVYI